MLHPITVSGTPFILMVTDADAILPNVGKLVAVLDHQNKEVGCFTIGVSHQEFLMLQVQGKWTAEFANSVFLPECERFAAMLIEDRLPKPKLGYHLIRARQYA